jgi:hypothetical protein
MHVQTAYEELLARLHESPGWKKCKAGKSHHRIWQRWLEAVERRTFYLGYGSIGRRLTKKQRRNS